MESNMNKTEKKSNEFGRSLIEMLAVLAVIGVFCVGLIFVYRYALNQYKANTLKSDLASMAATTSIKLSTSSDFRIYGNLKYPYVGELNDNQTFSITVSEISKGVCLRLMAKPWTLPYEILVNNLTDGRCQDKNEMKFSFYNSLYDGMHKESEEESVSSVAPPEDFCRPSCRQGCVETCRTDRYWCWRDGCACYNGKKPPACTQVIHCPSGSVEITNCAGEKVQCCPDYEICPPVCP